ncbi:uncharacterized protein PAE49_019475 [Odontesthes bonariensis]
MTLKKMLPVVACLLLFLFQGCTAHALQCNVTRDGHQMIYRVSAVSERMKCNGYSWTNMSNDAIATHSGHVAPVTNSSPDSLTLSECLFNVSLEKFCMLENGQLIDVTAICTSDCREEALPRQEDGSPTKWIKVAVPVAVVVFICLVLLGLFYKKYKDKLLRTCNCLHVYTLVMKPNSIPNPPDVEAGNHI